MMDLLLVIGAALSGLVLVMAVLYAVAAVVWELVQ